MKAPRLSALALAGTLALAGCKEMGGTPPPAVTDEIADTRTATQVGLSDGDPSECIIKEIEVDVEWDLIDGKCDKNGLQGHGKAVSGDGDVYDGEWKDGKFDGYGIYTWLDGRKYDGGWKDGKMDGYGIRTWPSGDKYIGDFKNGKYDGYGVYIWSNGKKFVGEWKGGKPNGYGIRYSVGKITEGEWQDGKSKVKEYKTPDAMYGFAVDLADSGKLEEAKEVYRHIMEIAPDSDAAVKAAERLLVLSGKSEDAPKTGE